MNGEELKDKRLSLGLTQEELGKMVGVSVTTYNRWERGVNRMRKKTENQLNQIFDGKDISVSKPRNVTYGICLNNEEKRSLCFAIDDRIENLFNNASKDDRKSAVKEIALLSNLREKISKEI